MKKEAFLGRLSRLARQAREMFGPIIIVERRPVQIVETVARKIEQTVSRPKDMRRMAIGLGAALGTIFLSQGIREMIDVMKERHKRRKFEKNLEEVIMETPELHQYPIEKVRAFAHAYFELNPDLVSQKEVLKSILKSSLAMGGIDPMFASKIYKKKEESSLPMPHEEIAKEVSRRFAVSVSDIILPQ